MSPLFDDQPEPVGSPLISARRLAQLAGVSVRTVEKWTAEDGLAVDGRTVKGFARYDRASALAWVEEHRRGQGGHGGKREGAGRKPADEPGSLTAETDPATDRGSLVAAAKDSSQELRIGSVEEILESAKSGRLNATRSRIMGDVLKAAHHRAELDKVLGTLVDVSETRAAYGQHITRAGLMLDGLPNAVADSIASAFSLAAETVPTLRALVRSEIDRVRREIARDPLGETSAAEAA